MHAQVHNAVSPFLEYCSLVGLRIFDLHACYFCSRVYCLQNLDDYSKEWLHGLWIRGVVFRTPRASVRTRCGISLGSFTIVFFFVRNTRKAYMQHYSRAVMLLWLMLFVEYNFQHKFPSIHFHTSSSKSYPLWRETYIE